LVPCSVFGLLFVYPFWGVFSVMKMAQWFKEKRLTR